MQLKDLENALEQWQNSWQYDVYENNKSDWSNGDDHDAATITYVLEQKIKEIKNG